MNKKVYIETFGCQMNDHDSDRMKRHLLANSFLITDNEDDADAVILNTCSVRDKAERKVLSRLGRLKRLKKNKKDLVIAVSGCMAQRLGEKILDKHRHVDLVFGTHVINDAPKLLSKAFEGRRVLDVTFKNTCDFKFLTIPKDAHCRERVTANVTIMNGCSNFCTYCIVPYVRGPEVSRDPDDILNEIKRLAEGGVKEVTLLGQNVNSYGLGSSFKLDFPGLLEKLQEVNGLERIRFVTSHPKDLSDRLIGQFKDLSKLCEHIHLPVQSGSDKILKKMNRNYTAAHYKNLVEKLKKACPEIAITTDIIVGYPGEDDEDFEKTYELVKDVQFDGSFSFRYSVRPGTGSSEKDLIPVKTASERLSRLQELQKEITFKKNEDVVGSLQEILVEGQSKRGEGELFGRTRTNKIVNFKGGGEHLSLLKVRITEAKKNSLFGEKDERR